MLTLQRFKPNIPIFAAAAALLAVAVPRVVFASPPGQEAVEQAPPGVLTLAWWRERFGPIAADDVVQLGWHLLAGVLLFIGGWIVAKLLSWIVFRVLIKTSIDDRLAERLGIKTMLEERDVRRGTGGDPHRVERTTAKVVFYLLMALVVVGVLEFAGLEQAASPIQGLVATVAQALPLIGKAILILVVAYILALVSSKLVIKALTLARVDKRFAELDEAPVLEVEVSRPGVTSGVLDVDEPGEERPPAPRGFSETAGQVVFWLVIVLGIAGALDALQIPVISGPLSNVISSAMGLLPALGVAALISIGGWILAKIARVVVTRALTSLGFDTLVAKLRLSGLFGSSTPSKVAGWLTMAFIVIQTAIAALAGLGLETLSRPMTQMMAQFWDLLPALLIAVVFVVVGVFVGRLLRGITQKTLESIGFDRWMDRIGFGKIAEREDDLGKPAGLVGYVVQVGIVLLALVQALNSLELNTWANYLNVFLLFAVTRAAVALVIVGVGFAVGNYVRDLIEARQRASQPKLTVPAGAEQRPIWMAEFARYGVLVFAFTMAVHQLGFADEFVLLSFALLFGALCLAGALAFGLGAREVAGEIVRERYRKTRQAGAGGPIMSQPLGK